MIAREDDIVTCVRGHPLYRITRDVMEYTRIMADQFEALHPRTAVPLALTRFQPCPMCGQPWHARSGWIGRRTHFHFEGGWRPRLPESRPI